MNGSRRRPLASGGASNPLPYLTALEDYCTQIERESALMEARLSDVMRAGDMEHNRNVALLERAERAEAEIVRLRSELAALLYERDHGEPPF